MNATTNARTINLDTAAHKATAAEMRGVQWFPGKPVLCRETEDAAAINRILNDPSVFPLISIPDQQPFDIAPLLADPRYVFLTTAGGVIVCMPDIEPTSGIYEIHINFLVDYRGRNAIDAAIEACRWMFTHTNCMTLVTRVPIPFNKAAEIAAQKVGGRFWFERKAIWPTADGPVDVAFYALTLQDWSSRYPEPLIESGRAFHVRLEREYERHNFVHQPHPADESHDLAVGLCAEMIYGGEPEKGVILYNRWARLAGYRMMNIISRNPLMIDISEALVHVTGDTFKVIQCRSQPV